MDWPSRIMWSSRDDHTTTHHPCHLISRPSSWRTWDLRAPTLFSFNLFLSDCMLNAFLIALQCPHVYLFSILTQRPIVCAPVPCSHLRPLHPHVDSCPSYRCLPDHVPIVYLYLQPGGSILYK